MLQAFPDYHGHGSHLVRGVSRIFSKTDLEYEIPLEVIGMQSDTSNGCEKAKKEIKQGDGKTNTTFGRKNDVALAIRAEMRTMAVFICLLGAQPTFPKS